MGALTGYTWYRQSAIRWDVGGLVVHVDPWGITDDEHADLVFVTHAHLDHFSVEDIDRLRDRATRIVAPVDVARELSGEVLAVRPGEEHEVAGVRIRTVPAYNVVEDREQHHPRSNGWVGYVLEAGGRSWLHAGDTDAVPELDEVRVDAAFLPIGGTYTMDATEAGALVRRMRPDVAVPMHFGFVVGDPSDGDRFRTEAAPVPVEVLEPRHPFGPVADFD